MSTLLLSPIDVQEIVRRVGVDALMGELTARLGAALAEFEPEKTEIPIRTGFNYRSPHFGLIEWMPLMQRGERVLMKSVGYHPHNGAEYGLPTILSTMSLFDPSTGRLLAMADGALLTAMRTGAASAVASRVLASPDSRTLGLIGCGAQAVTQLQALHQLFDFSEVLISDTDSAATASLPARVNSFFDAPMETVSAREAAERSDILCVATSVDVGAGPVFPDCETKPGLHVNAIGSDFPGKFEIPVELLRRSFVAADSIDQAMQEGECQQLERSEIHGTLVDLARRPNMFQDRRSKRTVFDSTGWALEDYVALELAIEYATDMGLGSRLDAEAIGADPRDPYGFLEVKKPVGAGQSWS